MIIYIYQCSECGWKGPQEEVGIASSDEGTHCWMCPVCLSRDVYLKEEENEDDDQG